MPVTDFYDRHPISEAQVLDAVRRRRGHAHGALTDEDLFAFDQDHYGGLAVVDTLARLAGITARSRVLDLCAGLGGPARFVASRRRCRVVALELNAGRAAGARRLSRLVGLGRQIRVVRADATTLPFAAGAFDACLSQEGLLHIGDKRAVLHEAHRVLAPGAASPSPIGSPTRPSVTASGAGCGSGWRPPPCRRWTATAPCSGRAASVPWRRRTSRMCGG